MLLQEKIESIKMTEHQTQLILSTKESAESHEEESDSNEDSIEKDDVFDDPDEELEV